jgi:16S rRNA (guanine527-N7)-methyltransferase
LPITKPGGLFIAYKGGEVEEELKSAEKALKKFGGEIIAIDAFSLTANDNKRSLIIIRKL